MSVPSIIDSSSRGLARADLAAWRSAGGVLAIHRAAYVTTEDVGFRAFWARAGAAGVGRGAYLFWRREVDPDRQAGAWARILEAVRLGPGDLPPFVDVEFSSPVPRAERGRTLARLIVAWSALARAVGVTPGIYTSARVWCDDLGDPAAPELAAAPLWLADYTRRPAPLVPPPWAGGDQATVLWRGARRSTSNWWLRQVRGNVRPKAGPLAGCCIDENAWHPGAPTGARLAWVEARLGGRTVAAYQKAHGLTPDGVIGPRTFARLAWERAAAACSPLPGDPVCTRR